MLCIVIIKWEKEKKVLKFGDAGISLLYRINHAISVLKDWDWGDGYGFVRWCGRGSRERVLGEDGGGALVIFLSLNIKGYLARVEGYISWMDVFLPNEKYCCKKLLIRLTLCRLHKRVVRYPQCMPSGWVGGWRRAGWARCWIWWATSSLFSGGHPPSPPGDLDLLTAQGCSLCLCLATWHSNCGCKCCCTALCWAEVHL